MTVLIQLRQEVVSLETQTMSHLVVQQVRPTLAHGSSTHLWVQIQEGPLVKLKPKRQGQGQAHLRRVRPRRNEENEASM